MKVVMGSKGKSGCNSSPIHGCETEKSLSLSLRRSITLVAFVEGAIFVVYRATAGLQSLERGGNLHAAVLLLLLCQPLACVKAKKLCPVLM